MDFLKVKIFTISLFCGVNFLLAQDATKHLQAAFSQSYGYESSKNYTAAIDAIMQVHNDKQYETCLRLAWLYYSIQKNAESIAFYQKAIQLMPTAIEPKLGIVQPLSAANNWDKVLAQYLDILKIDPSHTAVNYRTGLIYYNKQNYAVAKKYFDVYLNLYPFDFDAINISAWNSLRMGKLDVAKALFNKAMLVYPNSPDCLEGLKLCK